MSGLPTKDSRSLHDSPPMKSRKALSDKTEIMNSPHFSKIKDSNIPGPSEMIKVRPSRTSNIKDTDTRAKFRNLSNMASFYNQGTGKSNDMKQREPLYVQRQHSVEERQAKMIEVTREKITQINKKIKDTRDKMNDLEKVKTKVSKDIYELKSKITDLEVHIINLDRKIEHQVINCENSKKHYEQVLTLQIKERQNQIIRELDELRDGFEKELKHAQSIEDDETKKQISELHEQLTAKERQLQTIFDANDKKLDIHREQLSVKIKEVISSEELKNEEFTKVFEQKTEEFEKLSFEVVNLSKDIENMEKETARIKTELSSEKEFEENVELTTRNLERQIEELMRQNDDMTENLNSVISQYEIVNIDYESAMSKIDKEKSLRRKIQSTIEELNGKLRVYVRLLSSSKGKDQISISKQDDTQLELQSIRLNGDLFKFNKVFDSNDKVEDVIDETITIAENALQGIDTSFVIIGDDSLSFDILKKSINYLDKRSQIERYQSIQFSYSFQAIDINSNTEGIIETGYIDGKFKLFTNSKTFHDFNDLNFGKDYFINFIIEGQSETKKISSNLFILNVSTTNMSLFNSLNLSSRLSSPKSLLELLEVLYTTTKAITLFNINLKENMTVCLGALKTAQKLNSIDTIKSKKTTKNID